MREIKPHEQVYCVDCEHFYIDNREIPECDFEDTCDIFDCDDSKSFKDRPMYKNKVKPKTHLM